MLIQSIQSGSSFEENRLLLQATLDRQKSSGDRNRLGQYATPPAMARDLVSLGLTQLPEAEKIHFLDPGFGTGALFSALHSLMAPERIGSAVAYEIDPLYGLPARNLWKGTPLDLRLSDFAKAEPHGLGANLLVCNPPYIRHHHLDSCRKSELQKQVQVACGMTLNKFSGFYCHYMGLAHRFMAENGIAVWLIPSKFMETNYGKPLQDYLLKEVTLLQIHNFPPSEQLFSDAQVSSSIVLVRNAPAPDGHSVKLTYGASLFEPKIERVVSVEQLAKDRKWKRYEASADLPAEARVTLGQLFDVTRGIVTGAKGFFIMSKGKIEEMELPMECFRPVLPDPKRIPVDEIHSEENGWPTLENQMFVLDTNLSEEDIKHNFPKLSTYLEGGKTGSFPVNLRETCRKRSPWYRQESRSPAPIVVVNAFRKSSGKHSSPFILNHSEAIATSSFAMLYPKRHVRDAITRNPKLLREVWSALTEIDMQALQDCGRGHGTDMLKFEPGDLTHLPVDHLIDRFPELDPKSAGS